MKMKKRESKPLSDKGAKELAYAVLRKCAKDICLQKDDDVHEAEDCVRTGGVDLYFEICGLNVSREKFIEFAKENTLTK